MTKPDIHLEALIREAKHLKLLIDNHLWRAMQMRLKLDGLSAEAAGIMKAARMRTVTLNTRDKVWLIDGKLEFDPPEGESDGDLRGD